jgi:hypothetical protein
MQELKIFILTEADEFSVFLTQCLTENGFEVNYSNKVISAQIKNSIVIINAFSKIKDLENKIDQIITKNYKKIILLENALDLYLNSEKINVFSVYEKLIPKNETCIKYLKIEEKIINSDKPSVIFRVSQIYGPSITKSIVNKILDSELSCTLQNTKHDFIYEGDVIQAIEIALKSSVNGLFDIASEQTIDLRKLFDYIENIFGYKYNVKWKRKKSEIKFNCDNFRSCGWKCLIDIEKGLNTIKLLRDNDVL